MNDKLKELLGDELSKQVLEKLGKDVNIDIINNGNWIPKNKFDTKLEELKLLNQQVGQYKENASKVETLINENKELKSKYDTLNNDHTTAIEAKEKEISNINKKHTLLKSLNDSGAIESDLLLPLFDLDKLELNDNKIIGFDDLIKPIKEARKTMFKETQISGNEPNDGNSNLGGSNTPQVDKDFNVDLGFMDNIK